MSTPTPGVVHVHRVAVEEYLLPSVSPVILLKIARELAADMRPIEDILKIHGVSETEWGTLKDETRFRDALRGAVIEWQSVANTTDRVRVKSLHFVEEALPEFYARAHDPKEPLSAKIEVLKAIAKIAGVAERSDAGNAGGQRMIVNINLGADHQLTFAKDITPTARLLPDEVTDEDEL